MNRVLSFQNAFLAALCLLAMTSVAETDAGAVARQKAALSRAEFRAALGGGDGFQDAILKGLKSEDPFVRRYALFKLYEADPERALKASRLLLDDPSSAVRQVAKAVNRNGGGLYRDNEALSMSDQNDHATIKVKTIRPVEGKFVVGMPLPRGGAVELWFGKPGRDLYVWLNGVYLGQYDFDHQRGSRFRLDATKETRFDGENLVEIKTAKGVSVSEKFTVEVLAWK